MNKEWKINIPDNVGCDSLPDLDALNEIRLAQDRIFYIDYEIDMYILRLQRAIININLADKDVPIEERLPIKILIDSPGGFLTETLSLVETIMASKTPIITINICESYSAAALLLMAGHKRYAMRFSTALLHSGSAGVSGSYEQTVEWQKNYKNLVDNTAKYILDRTGMDSKIYNRNKSKEWYLSSSDQVTYGLVDEVIDNLFEVI